MNFKSIENREISNMDKIQEQILKNQSTIMTFLHYGLNDIRTDEILGNALTIRNSETNKILDSLK